MCGLLNSFLFAAVICYSTVAAKEKIFGGQTVNITSAPYMAYFDLGPSVCSASIVSPELLITAAHCAPTLDSIQNKKAYVMVGVENIYGKKGRKCEIATFTPHPKYESESNDYDIAIIRLKRKLKFSKTVYPIEMILDGNVTLQHGTSVDTLGYGRTENHTRGLLMKVTVPIVNNEKCNKILYNKITPRMICAGGEQGKDSCNGDSGGPLAYNNKLLGVVSWGAGPCGSDGVPGVYASLPAMRRFIKSVIAYNNMH